MAFENDAFIFQCKQKGIYTILFVRKNESYIYKLKHLQSLLINDFIDCEVLNDHQYYEEIRTFIRKKDFEEIVPESPEGQQWLCSVSQWLLQIQKVQSLF